MPAKAGIQVAWVALSLGRTLVRWPLDAGFRGHDGRWEG
jgi:hypothetical protein